MAMSPLLTPTASAQKPVIMVVDDDFAARLQMRFSLENEGFTVVEAEGGAEASTFFQQEQIDLILLDVIMPEIDGFATCRMIRALPGGLHTPIVMITGLEDEETITQAFDAGATDFISKPINLLVLGFRVRYWLRSGAILGELQISQKRLFKAQEIAKLGHWERDLHSGDFKMTCNSPHKLGLQEPYNYEALFAAIVAEEKDGVRTLIDDACRAEESFSVQYRVRLADGSERTILNQGEIIRRESPQHHYIFGIIQDITELKQAEDKIRHLAFYDNLTGLANRALFREYWTKLLPMTERSRKRAAIFFLDLDHFKRINDTLGHPSGDKALITIAERLKTILRQSDVISRFDDEKYASIISRVGGDEFNILVTDIRSTDDLAKLAERIIEALAEPLLLEGEHINLTASLGVSVYPDDGEDIDTLLKNADTAMYEAKEKGRNNYQFFQSAMNHAAMARFHMSNNLRRALLNNEFTLYYQPQFTNTNGCRLTGVEALIRWIDPDKGLTPPDRFLPFAEESGFIHSINDWVLRTACRQAQQWVDAGRFAGCRMGVNISGNNINFKILGEKIIAILKETGLAPQHLELELTERVMMENTEEARLMLLQLRDMGVTIAIDDFGTGYSALSHLQLFPLSTLKIDKSFVKNIDVAENGLSLLHSIVDIAKSFNLKVVAEGVETEDQKAALGRMNCDELQGYLLGRPLPKTEIEKVLLLG
jgi:diguanylate cyclase (GGDEF)-like protein